MKLFPISVHRKNSWFIGAVAFYFRHTLDGEDRLLALVRSSVTTSTYPGRRYIPMVTMDARTTTSLLTGVPQPPFTSEADDCVLAVIDVGCIDFQVGLLSCPDVEEFKVITKTHAFRLEDTAFSAGKVSFFQDRR
jgi:hypothetical protein